jgi:glycosyltransferase 2 family protein
VLSAAAGRRGRRIGVWALGLVVSAAAIAVLATIIDVSATLRVLSRTDVGWLALTMLMVPAQVVLRAMRWRLLLPRRPDGHRPATSSVTLVMLAGYLANLILPARLGEPVRAYLLSRREGIGFARVLGSVLLERVIDLATLALVGVAAAIVIGAPEWLIRGTGVIGGIGVMLILLLAASAIPRAARALGQLLGGRVQALTGMLVHFGEGAGGGDRLSLTVAIGLSTVTWFFVAATFWLLGRALDLGIGPGGAMLIAAVTTLGTAIPSAPASIGTFELAAVVAAGALGIPGEQALALALLAHAVSTLPFVVAGVAAVGWMSISISEVASEATAAWPEAIPVVERAN